MTLTDRKKREASVRPASNFITGLFSLITGIGHVGMDETVEGAMAGVRGGC